MKRIFLLILLAIAAGGCARDESQEVVSRELSDFPAAAKGRAAWVSPIDIIPYPKRFHGRRVILSGVWTSGFERSRLDLENAAQDYRIWVEFEESKIDEPMGDLSDRLDSFGLLRESHSGSKIRITAEGTFYFRKLDLEQNIFGFGHRGASDAYFLVDRIFEYEPLE